MKNNFIYFTVFAVGAAIGSAVTMQYFKTKYEKFAQEEIESVREFYGKSRLNNSTNDGERVEEPKEDIVKTTANIKEYKGIIDRVDYSSYSEQKQEEVKEMVDIDKPYVISPEEFDNPEVGYENISLTYYADGYLADDMDELVDDVDDTVGLESLKHFGDYDSDPDCVFVRNDRLQADYEILLDERNYKDVVGE